MNLCCRWRNLQPPPGFKRTSVSRRTTHLVPNLSFSPQSKAAAPSKASKSTSDSYEAMKDKRAWDLAIAPAKSLPMQAFMLYMSGGGVQIFSMGIVFMLLLSPFKNVAGINTSASPALSQKLVS